MGRKVSTLKKGPKRFLKPVGNPADPDGLFAYLQRYLDYLRVKGCTEATLWGSERYLRDFIAWCDTRAIERPLADWHQPVLAPLALPHQQRAALDVHVEDMQIHQLHAADTGAVEGFQHRPVAQAQRIAGVDLAHHRLDFLDAQHMLG